MEAKAKDTISSLLLLAKSGPAAQLAQQLADVLSAEAEVARRQAETEAAEAARQNAAAQAEQQEAARKAAAQAALRTLGEHQADATAALSKATAILATLQGRRKGHEDQLKSIREKLTHTQRVADDNYIEIERAEVTSAQCEATIMDIKQ